jgi:carbonic anhydrase
MAQSSPRGTTITSVQPTFEAASTEDIRVAMDDGHYVTAPSAPFEVDSKNVNRNYQDYAEATADGSKKKNYLILALGFCVVLLLALVIALAVSTGGDDDDASASSVAVAAPKEYSYADDEDVPGPSQWFKDFPLCKHDAIKNGGQSPIDITTASAAEMSAGSKMGDYLTKHGDCYKYSGKETDNTWKVALDYCEDASLNFTTEWGEWKMLQFHLHAPSENTLNGKLYDAEIHFVYVDSAGIPAGVIGVFLEAHNEASDNAFLAQFWDNFDNEKHENDHAINPYDEFFPKSAWGTMSSYYTWNGSLTTPPCWSSEWGDNLKWHLMTQPVTMSTTQLRKYTARFPYLPQTKTALFNNRPTQPLNGRVPKLNTNMGYSYAGEAGLPDVTEWNTHEAFPWCNPAKLDQSPINIDTEPAEVLAAGSKLGDYLSTTGECIHYKGKLTENTWKVDDLCYGDDATLNFDAYTFGYTGDYEWGEWKMLQFHMHAPSENTLNGKLYDAEVHFVYVNGSGIPKGVIGVFLEAHNETSHNEFLGQFWDNFDNQKHTLEKPMDPYTDFFPRTASGYVSSYYTWNGSLTTPPCWSSEWGDNLKWHLLTQPAIISTTQLNKYKAAISQLPQSTKAMFNNRPTQPLNGRVPKLNTKLDYSYAGELGLPDVNQWNDAFPECNPANREAQSPIDLPAQNAYMVYSSDMESRHEVDGKCVEYYAKVTENTWKVEGLDKLCNEFTTSDGTRAYLAQFHLHTPSENTMGGKHYDAEMHFVYLRQDDNSPAGVVGVFLEAKDAASDNAFLAEFWDNFDNKKHYATKSIDPVHDFFPRVKYNKVTDLATDPDSKLATYYTWDGSLTTPPCWDTAWTQPNLKWHMFTQPVTMSTSQLNKYKAAISHLPQTTNAMFNNRPTQPLGSRVPQLQTDMTWSYTSYPVAGLSAKGPKDWVDVDQNCLSSGTQSPIDIDTTSITEDDTTDPQGLQNWLTRETTCTDFKGKETENTWKADIASCGFKFTLPSTAPHNAGNATDLAQFHLHAPSEHTIDGKHYDAELHFVHTIDGQPAAVIGVMLEAKENAEDNAFLAKFWDYFDNKEHTTTAFNPYKDFLPQNEDGKVSSYYSYSGSLTTPNCGMGASWHLLKDPITISYAQLDKYRARLAVLPQTSDSLVNNRPVQTTKPGNNLRWIKN